MAPAAGLAPRSAAAEVSPHPRAMAAPGACQGLGFGVCGLGFGV